MRNLAFSIAVSALLCSGCSVLGEAGDENSDNQKLLSIAWQTIAGVETKVSRDEAAAIPYATIGIQIGSGPQVTMILGAARGEERDWYAGDKVLVVTKNGRIIRTLGLEHDLDRVLADTPPTPGLPYLVSFDIQDQGVFGAGVNCSTRDTGAQTIEVLGAQISTIYQIEHCESPRLDWTFDNEYWRDAKTGLIWRSSQHTHPEMSALTIEVLRPDN